MLQQFCKHNVLVNSSNFPELKADLQAVAPLQVICISGEPDYKRWVGC